MLRQILFDTNKIDDRKTRIIDIDHQVDIAVGPCVAASPRSEERDVADAARAQLRLHRQNSPLDLVLTHHRVVVGAGCSFDIKFRWFRSFTEQLG